VTRAIASTLLAVLALAGCGGDSGSEPEARTPEPAAARTPVQIGDAVVQAEIADDNAERTLGLGERDRLARDAGMYFVLTDDAPRIWMKGMRFPLDLVWIDDGRVVDVTADVPDEPNTPEAQLPIYSPSQPANRLLEVNAGWAERNGVRPGDRVRLGQHAAG
jgi:uncharacterized membrane protein (UPF0127 family)